MVLWNLRDDTLTLGQWFVGTLYLGPSGLSPDGKLLVYCARKGAKPPFTAISRPPYFTALAFWENPTPWTGGGFFADRRRVVLGTKYENPRDVGGIPDDFEITDVWEYFSKKTLTGWDDVVPRSPEANHGFRVRDPGVYEKRSPALPSLTLLQQRASRLSHEYTLEGDGAFGVTEPTWADWAPDGSLLVGASGCLYRKRARRGGTLEQALELVADLRGQTFESVPPTESATRWP